MFEHFGEVVDTVIADACSNLLYRFEVAMQNCFCLFDAKVVQVFDWRDTVGRFENLSKIYGTDFAKFCEKGVCDIAVEVVFGDIFCRGI